MPARRQRRQDRLVQQPILLGDQHPRLVVDDAQQRAQSRQRHARRREPRAELLLEPGDPDLEELVEIVADDAEEAEPLEQRGRRILRERQHPAIERELRQLAIDRRWTGWLHRVEGTATGRTRPCRPAGANGTVCGARMTAILQRGPAGALARRRARGFLLPLDGGRRPIAFPACPKRNPTRCSPSSISDRTASGSKSAASRATRSTSSTRGARRCASARAWTTRAGSSARRWTRRSPASPGFASACPACIRRRCASSRRTRSASRRTRASS